MAEPGLSERKADRSIPSVYGLAPTASAKPDFSSFNLRPYWDLSLPSGPAVCNLWTFCNCCPGRTEFAQINCLPGISSIHYHPETHPRPSAQSPTRHNAYEQPHRLQRQRIQGCRLAPVCLRQKGSLGQKVRFPPSSVQELGSVAVANPTSETWRYTGPFSRFNRFKGLFPGFGIASVAFAGYCAYEHFFLQNDPHHNDPSDSSGHH